MGGHDGTLPQQKETGNNSDIRIHGADATLGMVRHVGTSPHPVTQYSQEWTYIITGATYKRLPKSL